MSFSYFLTIFKCCEKHQNNDGGAGGIRTLDPGFSPDAPLAGVCLQPLSHYSEK